MPRPAKDDEAEDVLRYSEYCRRTCHDPWTVYGQRRAGYVLDAQSKTFAGKPGKKWNAGGTAQPTVGNQANVHPSAEHPWIRLPLSRGNKGRLPGWNRRSPQHTETRLNVVR